MRHPAVAEAAAFPVPHPRLGEDVAAAVVLRPGDDGHAHRASPISPGTTRIVQSSSTNCYPRSVAQRGRRAKSCGGGSPSPWRESRGRTHRSQTPQSVENTSADDPLVNELMEIWKRLLKIEHLSLDDDFFEKGGDSLLAMEMLVELESLTGLTIPSSILFEAPTIRQLAQKLSERSNLRAKKSRSNESEWQSAAVSVFPRQLLGLGIPH